MHFNLCMLVDVEHNATLLCKPITSGSHHRVSIVCFIICNFLSVVGREFFLENITYFVIFIYEVKTDYFLRLYTLIYSKQKKEFYLKIFRYLHTRTHISIRADKRTYPNIDNVGVCALFNFTWNNFS